MTTNNQTNSAAKPYAVQLWGSHPDAGHDDCWMGDDYATVDEVSAVYMATVHDAPGSILDWDPAHKAAGSPNPRVYWANWAYIELAGPGVRLIAKNPRYNAKRARREAAEANAEWRREQATQAGMAFGCDGYNEAMGW